MAEQALRQSGVYCIRNIVSGRVYVGSSLRIGRRWVAHRAMLNAGKHHSRTLQRSWLKHGPEAFEWSVLEVVADPANLIPREQHWIDALNAGCPRRGFNVSPTAGNCLGVRHSAETRAKLSAARKGKPKSEAHRKAIGEAHRGRTIPEERRARVAEGVRRHFEEHPEARERMREVGRRNGAASAGRQYSEEIRAAWSAARRGSERYAASSRANLAKMTPEQKARGMERAAAARRGRPRHAIRALTYEQAELVRARKGEGATYDALEAEFGLDRASLFNIVKRKTYAAP